MVVCFSVFVLLLGIISARLIVDPLTQNTPFVTQDLVDSINAKAVNWQAGLNPGSSIDGASYAQIKAMLGALKGGFVLPRKFKFEIEPEQLPASWTAQDQWPNCQSMKVIRDQSACGSCWAFGAVEAISDRYCIFMNKNVSLSAGDMAFCCDSCGFGCGGGYPGAAWQYWVDSGLVEEGCYPYPFPSCDHHQPNSKNPCPSNEYPSAACPASNCASGWNGPSWNQDLHMGRTAYSVSGETAIMQEMYKNGPLETAFTVYEDFLTYKSGVYRHLSGGAVGGHAVKFMGWGVENGEKYWLVANSWNPDWGQNGYFKILRGVNECGIEDEANGGVPLK